MFEPKSQQRKHTTSPFIISFIYYLTNIPTKTKSQTDYKDKIVKLVKTKCNDCVFLKSWTPQKGTSVRDGGSNALPLYPL